MRGTELELIGYKIISKSYSQVRAIFAELGTSDTELLRALKEGHGIEFDSLHMDPVLHFVVSSQQCELLFANGIPAPTFLQILGSSEVIDLNEENAKGRFEALKKGE